MNKTIGETIKELRKGKGLTQKQLAERLQCTQATVAAWESQPNRSPGRGLLGKVADELDVPIDYLLNRKKLKYAAIPFLGAVESHRFKWNEKAAYQLKVIEDEFAIDSFALQIKDSLLEPLIEYNDYAIFERKVPAEGDVAAIKFSTGNATIKRFYTNNGILGLVTVNPNKIVSPDFYQIISRKGECFIVNSGKKEKIFVKGILSKATKEVKKR